jgi:membrane fusion protein (multidrug efflux system)
MTVTPGYRSFSPFALLVAVGLAFVVCDPVGKAMAQQAPPPPEVAVQPVSARDVPLTFEYAGRVTGSREVQVRARVSGILLERTYVEGQVVKQGDVLFRIDPETYQVQLTRAEAQLAQEQARLLQAERNWKRIQPLFQRETVSARERDEALSALDLARASVAVAEAEVKAARISLDYTKVVAPVSGVTSQEAVSEGSLVGTGATDSLLTRITQLDPLYVNFAIPDSEWAARTAQINEGIVTLPPDRNLVVEVRTSAGAALDVEGRLNYTDSSIDPQTGTISARAVVPNPDNKLLPGQFVRVVVKGMTLKNAITIPQPALMQGPQGPFVYIVTPEGQAQVRPVKLGRAMGDQWVVTDGLAPGDRVVTEGVIKVRPGQPVRTAAAAAPSTNGSAEGAQ